MALALIIEHFQYENESSFAPGPLPCSSVKNIEGPSHTHIQKVYFSKVKGFIRILFIMD
jgi:hypothetical protein